jgi:hypothetical protein
VPSTCFETLVSRFFSALDCFTYCHAIDIAREVSVCSKTSEDSVTRMVSGER